MPEPSKASLILERVIFYPLLILIVLAATPYGIVNPWRGIIETVFGCGIFGLGVLWMIEGIISRRWVNRNHLLLLPLFALAIFAYIQTLPLGGTNASPGLSLTVWQAISFDPYETRLMVLKIAAYAIFLGLLLRYTSTLGRLRILVLLVIGLCVASALFAILRQTTQHGSPQFLFPSVRLDRGYGQFVNRNHFAYMMELGFGLLLGLIAGVGLRRERALIYLAAVVPVWTALVLSNSRGGIISMFCQLLLAVLMFVLARRGRKNRLDNSASWVRRIGGSLIFRASVVLLLAGLILFAVVWVGGEQLASRFETISNEVATETQETRSGASRAEIWRATWRMIKEHPFVGVGFGGYWTAIPQYHNASGRVTPQQAHNDYLELLASCGIIGLLIGGWFLFLLIRFARERLGSADAFRRAACAGAIIGLFGIAVHSLVDFGLHIPINAILCLTLVAIATASERHEGKSLRVR